MPIIVVNKIDRVNARPAETVEATHDLLLELAKKGVSREQAYEWVQRNAMRSFETYASDRYSLDSQTLWTELSTAVPDSLHESIHTGIAAHVRYYVELWQYTRMGVDRRLQARMVERQLTYNVLTKEYKVAPLKGETREPFLTKDLREAQRVISELRVGQLAPVAALDKQELYYVRVRSDVSLGGVNSWFARMTGEAEETPWVQSSVLTPVRNQ